MAHASREDTRDHLPADLIALIDERLSRVSAIARHALLALAVFDDACAPELLASLTGLAKYEILSALEELEFGSLVVTSATGVRCRSELLRDRVLHRAARSVIALMHSRAASQLERRGVARTSQGTAWRIAEHWQAAGSIDRARRWQNTCWRHTIAIGQPMNAAHDIRQALSTCLDPIDRALLQEELAKALYSAGEYAALVDALTQRLALGVHCDDAPRVTRSLEFDLIDASLNNHDAELPYFQRLQALLRSRQLGRGSSHSGGSDADDHRAQPARRGDGASSSTGSRDALHRRISLALFFMAVRC